MPDHSGIEDAGRHLRAGGLVAFPTETVYGLGADATSPEAVARIFSAKGRPRFNPLIAHVADYAMASAEAVFTAEAETLRSLFWPGPLTLVLPRRVTGSVCDLACAGLGSIGLRMPAHPVAQAVLRAAGRPVAAPSANRSGAVSPTTAAHVEADLGDRVDLILDGGPCKHGIESTIVSCIDSVPVLLRPGAISRATLEDAIGPFGRPGQGIVAPGMLQSHYAPRASLRLNALNLGAGEVGLDFAGQLGAPTDLSASGDLEAAAANLYRMLRSLDNGVAGTIAVAVIPETGLGEAINDRLKRAAAPRRGADNPS